MKSRAGGPRPKILFLAFFCLALAAPVCAWARSKIIYDLDHTLINTNLRIIAILHDVGVEQNIPQLMHVSLEQVLALRDHDFSVLGISEAEAGRIFGKISDGTNRLSPFGKRFYYDSSYLVHDGVIQGAPEFVARLMTELDADVVYLSGRIRELFEGETRRQLARFNFPGFGERADLKDRMRLILKSRSDSRTMDEYKKEELLRLEAEGRVAAVFDDSSRNANMFRELVHPMAIVVRVIHNVANTAKINPGIAQITNYVHNLSVDASGKILTMPNGEQLEALIAQAKGCVFSADRK